MKFLEYLLYKQTMKILIVDDTEEIREILRLFIENLGHEVIEAVDGQDGFEKAKIHKPDLIITDAMMPKVDGFTLLRNIKMIQTCVPFPVYSTPQFTRAARTGNLHSHWGQKHLSKNLKR